MTSTLQMGLKLSLVVFMVGSLGAMGLELQIREAGAALRNFRFVMLTLLLGFFLCPAIAYVLSYTMRLDPPYAMGLLLLGMAPSAPFMPLVVRRAGGDLAYTAAFMLLAAVGTVVFMPIMAPLLIRGLTASSWAIGKPLLLFVVAPLAAGAFIREFSETVALRLWSPVKQCTNISAVVMLAILAFLYGRGFVGLVGTFAIAAQLAFVAIVTSTAFWLSAGLKQGQRSVFSLGMCTRNIGAAFAPLIAMKADPQAIIMVAFAVPVTLAASFGAARWLATTQATTSAAAERPSKSGVASGG